MLHSRAREVAAAAGVSLVAQMLLLVLVELTGRGTHAAYCGRLHLGREMARMSGRDRPYRLSQVGRALLELTRAGLIRTRRRWDPGFRDRLPALRYLSDELLAKIGELGQQRSKRRRRGAEDADTRPQPPPVTPDATPLDVTGGTAGVTAARAKLRGPPTP